MLSGLQLPTWRVEGCTTSLPAEAPLEDSLGAVEVVYQERVCSQWFRVGWGKEELQTETSLR